MTASARQAKPQTLVFALWLYGLGGLSRRRRDPEAALTDFSAADKRLLD
jgi:hypothetical protein